MWHGRSLAPSVGGAPGKTGGGWPVKVRRKGRCVTDGSTESEVLLPGPVDRRARTARGRDPLPQRPVERHVRFVQGRDLEPGERNAVVVNQAFAQRFWSGRNAVGSRVGRPLGPPLPGSDSTDLQWSTVVGRRPCGSRTGKRRRAVAPGAVLRRRRRGPGHAGGGGGMPRAGGVRRHRCARRPCAQDRSRGGIARRGVGAGMPRISSSQRKHTMTRQNVQLVLVAVVLIGVAGVARTGQSQTVRWRGSTGGTANDSDALGRILARRPVGRWR